LTGQTKKQKYSYYIHPVARHTGCDAFTTIPLVPIERAVFATIFENFADVPSFEKAIKDSLPDQNSRIWKAKFSGKEHIDNMSFDQKRELLYLLFGGKDNKGMKYGIYINKKGEGKDAQTDYFMYGRITGLRTLKADDIEYFEEKENYKTINVVRDHKDRKQADLQPGMA